MGCCAGKGNEIVPDQPGQFVTPFQNRKCRDVFWLLLFVIFWGGMLFIGFYALANGSPAKLLYGIDSMGNTCGAINTFDGKELNLVSATKLYYLDPFEIAGLDINSLVFAKSVCLPKCPPAEDFCYWDTHYDGSDVCNTGNKFRCPYYISQTQRVIELGHYDLYGSLPGIIADGAVPVDVSASYYNELASTNQTDCDLSVAADIGMLSDVWDGIVGSSGMGGAAQCGQAYQHLSKVPNAGPCYPVFARNIDYLNRCLPDTSSIMDVLFERTNDNSTVGKALNEPEAVLQRYASDLNKGIAIVLLCGLALGCFMALFWMVILRYFAGVMAWVAIILINFIFAAGCFLCFQKAGLFGEAGVVGEYITNAWAEANLPPELDPVVKDKQVWVAVAWITFSLFLLVLLLTIVMIRRIKIAIACLKVASQAVASMPSVMFFPILPFLCLILVVAYWITVAAMLYTVGDVAKVPRSIAGTYQIPGVDGIDFTGGNDGSSDVDVSGMSDMDCFHSPGCAFQIQWDNTLFYMGLYHLFGLLWTVQFIIGYGYVVLAAAISHYYWYRGDTDLMPRRPVLKAMGMASRYHLGSVALGSLIIAIIQFVRIMLEYIDRKTKRLQDTSPILKWCMCCVKCCMWYLEKIVKFITRNAYIMVAVKGTSYCASAARAVGLILGNILRLAAVNVIGDFLIFIGKLCVVGTCGVVAFFFADIEFYTNPEKHPSTFLSSPVAPIVLTVIVAYICASVFFQVYEMAIDTVLLCFCEDCDVHGEPKFAPPLLMKAIGEQPLARGPQQQFIASSS